MYKIYILIIKLFYIQILNLYNIFIKLWINFKDNIAEATVETNGVEDAKYGRGGYDRGYGGGHDRGYGGGRGGYGRGHYGGRGGYGGGRGGYGRGCRYGRCGHKCCSYAGEVVEGAKP